MKRIIGVENAVNNLYTGLLLFQLSIQLVAVIELIEYKLSWPSKSFRRLGLSSVKLTELIKGSNVFLIFLVSLFHHFFNAEKWDM